mgnify:CR=1 FL=1
MRVGKQLSLFMKIFKYEMNLGKDLYGVRLNGLGTILFGLEGESYNSANSFSRNIFGYPIRFYKKGYSFTVINKYSFFNLII